jgi:hypothetical protein
MKAVDKKHKTSVKNMKEIGHLRNTGLDGKELLQFVLNSVPECAADPNGSRQEPVEDCCEYGNETSGPKTGREILPGCASISFSTRNWFHGFVFIIVTSVI